MTYHMAVYVEKRVVVLAIDPTNVAENAFDCKL